MRITARVAGLSVVTCILSVAACSSDDDPGGTIPDADGGSSSSSGQSSSGTSGSSSSSSGSSTSSSGSSGTSSSSSSGSTDAGTDADAAPPIVVGDGSLGSVCIKDDNCKSKVCSVGNVCVQAPSCRGSKAGKTPGVDTCGKAEPGDESCCKSLTLPTTTTRTLDKYEITSGRIRAFIDALPNQNLRKFAKDFAAANPTSELGKLNTEFPGYIELLPNSATGGNTTQLPIFLGAFPQDPINQFDGCYVSDGGYGAATYVQDPAVLKDYGIGDKDGNRLYSSTQLDTKPANCMPPVLLAAFCAWDGGELAHPSDYYEVWGHTTDTLGPNELGQSGGKYTKPWTAILKPGDFNWRNGHGGKCPIPGWPGCDINTTDDNPPAFFYAFPKGGKPANDDSISIGAPGRFPKDITAVSSPDGGGWVDVGGNLLEAAWPKATTTYHTGTENFCDTTNPLAEGQAGYCDRHIGTKGTKGYEQRAGTIIYATNKASGTYLPAVALIGGSFEGHIAYGDGFFAAATPDETKLNGGFAAHFQYGKVGGRCARTK